MKKHEETSLLGKLECEDNIKMYLNEIGDINGIYLNLIMDQCQVIVSKVTNSQAPLNAKNCLISDAISDYKNNYVDSGFL